MNARRLALIVWGSIALVAFVTNADFGSFRMDQPFLARSSSGSPDCALATFPYDSFSDYSASVLLNALNGGCTWLGPYVAHGYDDVQRIYYIDSYTTYADGVDLTNLFGGTNYLNGSVDPAATITWTNTYVAKTNY